MGMSVRSARVGYCFIAESQLRSNVSQYGFEDTCKEDLDLKSETLNRPEP